MKFALVTGGSRGIGRAVCIKLAEMGYNILINYKSNETEANNTAALVREKGVTAEIIKFDVANKEEVIPVLTGWMESNPDKIIEVLVNNAGIREDALMMWMKDEQWNSVIDTSLHGFFYVTRHREQYVDEKIWKNHQYCISFRVERIAGANQLLSGQSSCNRCHQGIGPGNRPQRDYGKCSSSGVH